MDWLSIIANLANRVPIERVLFPPRDHTKALEEFAATMRAPVAPQKAPPEPKTTTIIQEPSSPQLVEPTNPVAEGTACLPCSRDHLSTSSSALSEGIRFAREKGVKDHEVMRRIRIALDELNAMERIDLAPEETAKLKGAESELADWTLRESRELRHAITTIRDVESMEQTAARASRTTEEFMIKLWAIPEKECETCNEMRESIRVFMEKRKRR